MSRAVDHDTALDAAAEYASGTPVDLEVCRSEPIHLLGATQSHGVLVAVDTALVVRVVSANSGPVLGREPDRLLERPITDLIGAGQTELLRRAVHDLAAGESSLLPMRLEHLGEPGPDAATDVDVTVSRSDGLVLCEFEPARREGPFAFSAFTGRIRRTLQTLQSSPTVVELADRAVEEIRRLTGYSRVVIYRFDGDGPGHVIAEDRHPDWESWLGLWFPAIDVPPQARRLYLRNWIRSIADVDDPSAALVPPTVPGTDRPLDLSGSVLRSLSPYHLDYLRNIGVAASMSISLIKDGSLWGLVACHHSRPLLLAPETRAACEFLGAALSLQLVAIERSEQERARADAHTTLTRIVTAIPAGPPAALLADDHGLLDLVPASGALVRLHGRIDGRGDLPDATVVADLLDRLPIGPPGSVWSTDRLSAAFPEFADLAGPTSGVLVLPLSGDGDLIAWFRPEILRTVEWAADPSRPAVIGSRGQRLSPRGSHSVWRETVRGRSRPWSATEVELATSLGRAVSELVLRHAAELGEANAELRRSNDDLDSFAYVVAHDLKEPLRGIANSADFALEDAPDLDAGTVRRLQTTRVLAGRMDELLTSLLHFSQVGRSQPGTATVDMTTLADQVIELVAERASAAGVRIRRSSALPVVSGERALLREVLTNLVVNAIKYAHDEPRWVDIGTAPVQPPHTRGSVDAVYVRDNGIGIAPHHHEDVFRLFRRLDPDRGSGMGAGLAIARKIVERHGGRLWVDSDLGHGATFWLTLPTTPPGRS
ncbi:ATP-binding protein [Pseudonocardia abyssalis]|uniref:Sensor-like histidine kinase SenX3 n=1 Tax=Pseudonocardia abyssalis TaxID=2792008 RepID=A0ABS6UYA6_9PSEU|nr:ATP-binding protein [Pseudonocardia abyssalis]MBW0116733.1 GAF domain-containing protein [Pseudonocardia abyssalis]MBW0137243.1 GAF domain-containing protein [Pseudonocardia abyssalis]